MFTIGRDGGSQMTNILLNSKNELLAVVSENHDYYLKNNYKELWRFLQ